MRGRRPARRPADRAGGKAMTSAQLRNKMRRIREEREDDIEESGELNLVPYLDIVTNVVIFLLASVTYITALSNVNPEVPYDLVVKTMDTVRQDDGGKLMFPDVTLSAGIL